MIHPERKDTFKNVISLSMTMEHTRSCCKEVKKKPICSHDGGSVCIEDIYGQREIVLFDLLRPFLGKQQ